MCVCALCAACAIVDMPDICVRLPVLFAGPLRLLHFGNVLDSAGFDALAATNSCVVRHTLSTCLPITTSSGGEGGSSSCCRTAATEYGLFLLFYFMFASFSRWHFERGPAIRFNSGHTQEYAVPENTCARTAVNGTGTGDATVFSVFSLCFFSVSAGSLHNQNLCGNFAARSLAYKMQDEMGRCQ